MNKLRRDLPPLSVFALACGCIIGMGAFMLPGTLFLPQGGVLGTALAMLIGAAAMLIIAVNYRYLIARYPLSGGEMVYAQEIFGSHHSFILAWFLVLSYLMVVALNATALPIAVAALSPALRVLRLYTVAGYDIYLGEALLSCAALWFFAYLNVRGVRAAGVLQTVLVLLLLGAVLTLGVSAFISPRITLATIEPLTPPFTSLLPATLSILAVTPFAFVGFDTVPQTAEEFKFAPHKTALLLTLAILLGAAVYIILNTVAACVRPPQFINWPDYIATLPEQEGLSSLPVFYAARTLLGESGVWLVGAAMLAAILTGILGFYVAASRLLFAMSRANLIPPAFAELTERGTPSRAIYFVMAVALLATFLGRTALNWIVDMSSVGAALAFGYTSAAAYMISCRERRPGLMITGALGTFLSVLFLVLLLVPLPGFNNSLRTPSYACLAIWCVLGVIFNHLTYDRQHHN
ncbi:MAG: APC family permease [Succinivibrio sp.]|nr:APC family permease [Succinivibrio sp.]